MILIISDYHLNEKKVLSLINYYNPEYVLCLGDGQSDNSFYKDNNIISVRGNCDTAELPIVLDFKYDNKNFLLTHGHYYDVVFGLTKLNFLALEHHSNIVLYGHTHIQKIEEYDGIIFCNPGAIVDGNYALYENGKIILK